MLKIIEPVPKKTMIIEEKRLFCNNFRHIRKKKMSMPKNSVILGTGEGKICMCLIFHMTHVSYDKEMLWQSISSYVFLDLICQLTLPLGEGLQYEK